MSQNADNSKTYLVFFGDYERPSSVVVRDLSLYVLEPNEALFEWVVVDDDRDISNYKRVGNSVVYDPPVFYPPVKQDVDGMLTAIWDDPLWTAYPEFRSARLQVALMKGALLEYLRSNQGYRIVEAWADLKLTMPQLVVDLVEAKAELFNVPLLPPSNP